MARVLQRSLAAFALSSALLTSGCADIPVVGPALESVKPLLSVLDPVITPIKGMLGMGADEAAPEAAPTPRPRPRRRGSQAAGAQTASASGSVDVIQAEPTEAQYSQMAERNKEFDRLRTTGLMQLYGGETKMAIDSFEQAAKLRPEDAHIRELIELAKNPPRVDKDRPGAPLGGGESDGGIPKLPEGFLQ